MNKARRLSSCAAVVGLALGATLPGAALAHHAITLNYDPTSSGAIEGVVDEVFWANPHIHIYLAVTNDDGSTQLWDMEAGNLNVMRARGVSRSDIQVGDHLRATGLVGREGHPAMLANTLVKEDGTVLFGDPEAVTVAEAYGEDEE